MSDTFVNAVTLIGFVIAAVGGLVAFILGAVRIFRTVYAFPDEGTEGMILRCGRFVRFVKPGFTWIWPWIEKIRSWSIEHETNETPEIRVMTKDGLTLCWSGWVEQQVVDGLKMDRKFNLLDTTIGHFAANIVLAELQKLPYEEIQANLEKTLTTALEKLQARLPADEWGVKFYEIGTLKCCLDVRSAEIVSTLARTKLQVAASKLCVAAIADIFNPTDQTQANSIPEAEQPRLREILLLQLLGQTAPAFAFNGHPSDDEEWEVDEGNDGNGELNGDDSSLTLSGSMRQLASGAHED